MLVRLVLLAVGVLAVYRDAVLKVDWVNLGIGIPDYIAEIASADDTMALAMASSEKNALAAVDSEGIVKWRHVVSPGTTDLSVGLGSTYGANSSEKVIITGGYQLTGWNATSGAVLWTLDRPAHQVFVEIGDKDRVVVESAGDSWFHVNGDGTLVETHKPDTVKEALKVSYGHIETNDMDIVRFVDSEGHEQWNRDESLGYAVDGALVTPREPEPIPETKPAPKVSVDSIYSTKPVDDSNQSDKSTILGAWRARIERHLAELRSVGIIRSLLPSKRTGSASFGFDKLLVLATRSGRLVALDTEDGGRVRWAHEGFHNVESVEASQDRDNTVIVTMFDGQTSLINAATGTVEATIAVVEEVVPHGYTIDSEKNALRGAEGWEYTTSGDFVILEVSQRHREDRTVSLGTVLADNSVLYKYLNPNAVAVLTWSPSLKKLSVVVLDGVTGRLLTSGTHDERVLVDDDHPARLVMGEHWLAYTYWTVEAGSRLSLWDMYESGEPNKRVSPGGNVSAWQQSLTPVVHRYTYDTALPGPVRALGVSRTRFGVTLRDIILSFDGQIIAIPKVVVPDIVGGIVGSPVQGHLSHIRNVWGITKLVTEPSLLESTYLVVGFGGLDVFFTRAAPSGEFDMLPDTFATYKLVATTLLLGIMAFLLAPAVRRKYTQLSWR